MKSTLLFGGLVLGGLLAASPALAQFMMAQATAAARVEQRQQQERQVRPENYDLSRFPITDANERHWRNMLWTTAIVEPQADYVDRAIAQLLSFASRPGLSRTQQRTVEMALQVGTQLYLSNPGSYSAIEAGFRQVLERSPSAEWSAMSLAALTKAGASADQRQQWGDRLRQRFPQWNQDVYLYTALRELADLDNPSAPPPLRDLLSWAIAPNQLQMYVFCQPDRGKLCQAVLKDRNGQFVRQNGQLWSVSLLLRPVHSGLGWNFTRGQTPQGIFRIEGTRTPDPTTFRAYGSFPLVKLFVPYEDGVREFLPGRPGQAPASLTDYQALLPPSWRSYFPIQQTYWAGKAGRGLFRIHGSGEDPNFFTNNRRYPDSFGWNPSIGCLSALERYDDAGRLQQADMPKILDAFTRIGGANFSGYLVVVDLPGPISLEQIEGAIAN
ncbi:MAG TPA: hypothetical protein V6C78_13850 [Crinalium sp.]